MEPNAHFEGIAHSLRHLVQSVSQWMGDGRWAELISWLSPAMRTTDKAFWLTLAALLGVMALVVLLSKTVARRNQRLFRIRRAS